MERETETLVLELWEMQWEWPKEMTLGSESRSSQRLDIYPISLGHPGQGGSRTYRHFPRTEQRRSSSLSQTLRERSRARSRRDRGGRLTIPRGHGRPPRSRTEIARVGRWLCRPGRGRVSASFWRRVSSAWMMVESLVRGADELIRGAPRGRSPHFGSTDKLIVFTNHPVFRAELGVM